RLGVKLVVDKEAYDQAIINAERIQIEGAQGYSLSIYNGFYPYTTSRDITPHQVLADTNMPFGLYVEVYGTMRTFPISVANRYNEAGEMIGTSGGCY
ncbi:adenylosuccinate synthetase, partial [Enterococcus faecium]|uniref:adenylosuccinate synthetase n=1 Tax=Enterococcus faecium TaxID=1352 RepID=UPI0034E9620D